MLFTSKEIRELLAAWLALSLMFSLSFAPLRYLGFAYSLLMVGTAFVLHELSHKFVAQHYGRAAEFRIWWSGVALGMMMALATFLAFGPGGVIFFAAPGAVYVSPLFVGYASPVNLRGFARGEGLISYAGPFTNLILGVFFRVLAHFAYGGLGYVFAKTSSINVFLGFFNILPIPPLDGQKVFAWSKPVWGISALVLLALLVM
ncbi:MAG: metalloprotease [Thermoprotei archaeon]